VGRGRGSYGPLDRDRHFAIGWGADYAADYARARAFDATIGPVLPAIGFASRAHRAADRLWTGISLTGGYAEAEKPPSLVGQELFHGIADRKRAIAALSTGFRALANDLAVWQAANAGAPDASSTAQWLAADVTPTLEEWRSFAEHEDKSWWTKIATSWETFEEWLTRLRQLRALARAHGVVLQSPEPTELPKTIWQKGAEGKGGEATALLGVLKIGALGALTIMGIAGLYAAIREIRPKQKPGDPAALREVIREELARKSKSGRK
jgi:hypothetical protein